MKPGGRMWLKGGCEGDKIVLRLRDEGIGIAPDLLPQIFDLFTQADHSPSISQGGLGIGLTLVRRLVEMHGGTVEAHSEGLGKGSEFAVSLPACRKLIGLSRGTASPTPVSRRPAVVFSSWTITSIRRTVWPNFCAFGDMRFKRYITGRTLSPPRRSFVRRWCSSILICPT